MARSISALSNPMLSMFAIADSRSEPIAKADGSLNLIGSVDWGALGAGDGVAGGLIAAGAVTGAGAAGVCAVAVEAGVEGTGTAGLLDDALG